MIQLKPNQIPTNVTIMVAVGLLFCTSVPAAAIGPSTGANVNTPTDKASAEPEWEFKLSTLPYFTNYGPLIVRPNSSAQWGSVCKTGFDNVSALAACRSVGFDKITTASIGGTRQMDKRYANTGPIYITDVKCDPSVDGQLLQNCNYSTKTDECSHNNDVWLQCGKNPVTPVLDFELVDEPATGITGDPRVGRMKVQTMVNGSYNDICGAHFNDVDSTAACRTLGFDVTHAGKIFMFKLLGKLHYAMNYVECPAKNSGLKDCTYKLDPENRFSTFFNFLCGPLILDCHERHPEKWKFRIQKSETPGIGRLEMQPDKSKGWGTVCSNKFNDYSALIMCKAAGFPDVISARAILNYSSVRKPTDPSVNTTYLTDVVCDENSTSLTNCTYAYNPQGISPSSVCTNMTDVGIECSVAPPTKGGPSALPIVLGVIGAGILVGLVVGGVIMYKKRSKWDHSMNDDSDRVDYVAMDDPNVN